MSANNYIFTKEAYQLYHEIPSSLLSDFWQFFEQQRFIDKGQVILHFMVEDWFNVKKMPYCTTVKVGVNDINDVFTIIAREAIDTMVSSTRFVDPRSSTVHENHGTYLSHKGGRAARINMEKVFKKPSSILYKNKSYQVNYNLEFAEIIFVHHEQANGYDRIFGHSWWEYHRNVEKLIMQQIIADTNIPLCIRPPAASDKGQKSLFDNSYGWY